MQQSTCKNCSGIMKKLREIDFCLTETTLYLDAYPDHCKALEYYHQLLAERQRLTEQYQEACGPLTIYGNHSHDSWEWVKTPWPWECDAD